MAKVVGYDETKYKRFTCHWCAAIVEYAPTEVYESGQTNEGRRIRGLKCPSCGDWNRTSH